MHLFWNIEFWTRARTESIHFDSRILIRQVNLFSWRIISIRILMHFDLFVLIRCESRFTRESWFTRKSKSNRIKNINSANHNSFFRWFDWFDFESKADQSESRSKLVRALSETKISCSFFLSIFHSCQVKIWVANCDVQKH